MQRWIMVLWGTDKHLLIAVSQLKIFSLFPISTPEMQILMLLLIFWSVMLLGPYDSFLVWNAIDITLKGKRYFLLILYLFLFMIHIFPYSKFNAVCLFQTVFSGVVWDVYRCWPLCKRHYCVWTTAGENRTLNGKILKIFVLKYSL